MPSIIPRRAGLASGIPLLGATYRSPPAIVAGHLFPFPTSNRTTRLSAERVPAATRWGAHAGAFSRARL